MKHFVIDYLPWILSCLTIYQSVMTGNKNKIGWLVGLFGQVLWLIWILCVPAYGLIPLNIALWIIYARNYLKWLDK